MNRISFPSLLLFALLPLALVSSCSHKYDPDTLDLGFYQWNLWYDNTAESGQVLPSCGWEDLHRGMGKLVRIPAMAADHIPEKQATGVLWYHCRFTLPENWEERIISLEIKGAAPEVGLFLNEEQIVGYQGNEYSYEIDVSDRIYYTRDNHLVVMIRTMDEADWNRVGISGGILVKSKLPEDSITGINK